MKAVIVTPAVATTTGNSITAERWAGILRTLGHQVLVATAWDGEDCDLLIALHARRSNPSIERFRRSFPARPVVVALTGTDLYGDLAADESTRQSLALATRIVALQNRAGDVLEDSIRSKVYVIYQSAVPPSVCDPPAEDYFQVCVLAHLRDVKDPLRAAWASRCLPVESRIRIIHAGRLLESKWKESALDEQRINPRYRWLGEIEHDAAMQLLAKSRLVVVSSEIEGGANVLAEAVVCGIPAICSEIAGNIGMLGVDYPGYFRARDTAQLAALLNRAEMNPAFMESLHSAIRGIQGVFKPEREERLWSGLLKEIGVIPQTN